MASKLAQQIKSKKGFSSVEVEAFLSVQRVASITTEETSKMIRDRGVTPQQYNVLRILAGAGKGGLCCSEIAERMLTRDSDITRLVDKLVKGGLVTRERSESDRRVVLTSVTAKGRKIAEDLKRPLEEVHERRFGALGKKKCQQLVDLLAQLMD